MCFQLAKILILVTAPTILSPAACLISFSLTYFVHYRGYNEEAILDFLFVMLTFDANGFIDPVKQLTSYFTK